MIVFNFLRCNKCKNEEKKKKIKIGKCVKCLYKKEDITYLYNYNKYRDISIDFLKINILGFDILEKESNILHYLGHKYNIHDTEIIINKIPNSCTMNLLSHILNSTKSKIKIYGCFINLIYNHKKIIIQNKEIEKLEISDRLLKYIDIVNLDNINSVCIEVNDYSEINEKDINGIVKIFNDENKVLKLLSIPLTLLYYLYFNNMINIKRIFIVNVIVDKYVNDTFFLKYLKEVLHIKDLYFTICFSDKKNLDYYNNKDYIDKIIISKKLKKV